MKQVDRVIHALIQVHTRYEKGVDGRVKHGHDEEGPWATWAVLVKLPMHQIKKSLLRSFSSEKRPLSYINCLAPDCPVR
jgi:hypothetical protein